MATLYELVERKKQENKQNRMEVLAQANTVFQNMYNYKMGVEQAQAKQAQAQEERQWKEGQASIRMDFDREQNAKNRASRESIASLQSETTLEKTQQETKSRERIASATISSRENIEQVKASQRVEKPVYTDKQITDAEILFEKNHSLKEKNNRQFPTNAAGDRVFALKNDKVVWHNNQWRKLDRQGNPAKVIRNADEIRTLNRERERVRREDEYYEASKIKYEKMLEANAPTGSAEMQQPEAQTQTQAKSNTENYEDLVLELMGSN